MLQSSLRFIGLLFGGLLLTAIPGQRTFAQSPIATGFRVVSSKAVVKPGIGIMLEQSVLGADGTTMHPVTAIPRGFALAAAAQSGTRNLYLLRKIGKDSVMLLLTDSLGRTLQQPRQYMPKMGGDAKQFVPPRLFGLPGGNGFVLTYPSGKSSRPTLEVQALSPALVLRWQRQLAPTCLITIQHITASETHLWLVLKEYLALALRPRVLSFNLANGEVGCNQALAPNDELDVATVVPAGLLLLGTSDQRSSYKAPAEQPKKLEYRRDFALLLSLTGQREFGVGLGWPLPGRPPHYRWQSAGPLPNGGYQLVGETYRNLPNAGTIALGVLGAGMMGAGGFGVIPMGGYTTERPVGLVLAQISPAGQLAAVHELAVPEVMQAPITPSAVNDFPQESPNRFRFRGFSADHQQIMLNTSRQVLAYSLASQQLRPLTPARNATPTIISIEPDRVTIGWSLKSAETGSEFEQIALP